MLTSLHIQNYKSIHDLNLELGRVNVFIGENGCGKSNILEAVGLLSTIKAGRLRLDDLANKGIRITRPDMMVNAFSTTSEEEIKISPSFCNERQRPLHVVRVGNEYFNKNKAFKLENAVLLHNRDSKELSSMADLFSIDKELLEKELDFHNFITPFTIYEIQTNPLRGIFKETYDIPGRNGENLDKLLRQFTEEQWEQLHEYNKFISWLEEEGIIIDENNQLSLQGLRLSSNSEIGLRDKFMAEKKNIFSVENSNEGALHILFYMALLISPKTPPFFAIDNIENALNPRLCRELLKTLVQLSKENNKQSLITTHNPAVLDGLNLHDDEQRLFVVRRNKKGHTVAKRIEIKPDMEVGGHRLKLSELWMRGQLGGLPQNF